MDDYGPGGNITTKSYDAVGRLSSVTDAVLPTGNTTTYAYDLNGNLKTITDANLHATSFLYDNFNRRAKRTLPHGEFETYNQYDVLGRLQSKTDFKGKTTNYAYDSLDRLRSKVPDSTLNQPTVSFIPTATGQRASMSDASGSTTYTYDNRDRVKTKATPEGTLTYSYDDANDRLSTDTIDANGNTTSSGGVSSLYDFENHMTTNGGSPPIATTRRAIFPITPTRIRSGPRSPMTRSTA